MKNTAMILSLAIATLLAPQIGQAKPVGITMVQARAIALARSYDFMLFADECYSEVYASRPPAGVLEVAAETGIDVTIARPKIVQQPWGHAIAYYGADANARRFNFSGMVTPKQSISVYAESTKLSEEVLRELLEQVLAKLKFDLT